MRNFILLICLTFFYSCSSDENIPDAVIPPSRMQTVLWDMLMADELAAQLKLTDTTRSVQDIHTELYGKVFSLHNTNSEEFRKSFLFYQSRPDLFKPMLESYLKRSDSIVKKD